MIVSVEGQNATEKSTLLLTAPLPLIDFAFDLGHSRAWHGFYSGYFLSLNINVVKYSRTGAVTLDWRTPAPDVAPEGFQGVLAKPGAPWDITIYELPSPPQMDNVIMRGARELWDRFVARAGEAVQDDDTLVASIGVDTMTWARRTKIDAYLQTLQEKWMGEQKPVWKPGDERPFAGREKLLQIEYGPANDAIRDIFNACQGMGKNLVATHHLTDAYVTVEKPDPRGGFTKESMPSGELQLEGLNKTHNLVDVAIRSVKGKDFETQQQMITSTFLKCGYDLSLEGTQLLNPTWNTVANRINMSQFNTENIPTNELFAAWQKVQREKQQEAKV